MVPRSNPEFAGYLEYLGIEHKRGIPLSPESNGEVEIFNRTLFKTVRISQVEGKEWRSPVEDFLFQYRTTPQGVTGETPAKLLMGRELKSKIPQLKPSHTVSEQDWQVLMKEREALRKLKSKECTDRTRRAENTDTEQGDLILLEKKFQKDS